MAEKTITMHRLLSELKMMDTRIEKALSESMFVGCISHSQDISETVEKMSNDIRAHYESIKHLIANKKVMEAARIKSNANTWVEIGGERYTVADAIKRKSSIALEQSLLRAMKVQYSQVMMKVDNDTSKLKDGYAMYVRQAVREKPITEIDVSLMSIEEYVKFYTTTLVDPIDIKKKIDELETSIMDFMAEVDAVLSESNAVTTVTIILED